MADKENVLVKTNEFIQYFLPQIEKMPRNFKFIIGDRIVKIQLDLLELLIEVYYSGESAEKMKCLNRANILVEKLRHLMQICVNMRFVSLKHYGLHARRDAGCEKRADLRVLSSLKPAI